MMKLSYSGTCGATGNEANVTWTLSCDSTLTISGTGAMADWDRADYVPWYDYSNNITSIRIADGVTTIGAQAFYYCRQLTSITIPPSVTAVGSFAFMHCFAMESVYITDLAAWCSISFSGSASTPFYRNCYLSSRGGGNLYLNNELITALTIPDGVTTIGSNAFTGCLCLTSVDFNQATSAGRYAFSYCWGLTEQTIPSTLTAMGDYMFYHCDNLTDLHVSWESSIPEWPTKFTTKSPQSDITLHVHCGTEELYQAADGWKDYTIEGEGGPYTITVESDDPTMGTVDARKIDN